MISTLYANHSNYGLLFAKISSSESLQIAEIKFKATDCQWYCVHCFDIVGWVSGIASGLQIMSG